MDQENQETNKESEPQKKFVYKLSPFGTQDTINDYKKNEGKDALKKTWHDNDVLVLKRKMFPIFSGRLKISRRQLEITCEEIESKKTFWVADLSSNVTLLNGVKMESGSKKLLRNNDKLSLVWRRNATLSVNETLFGVQFEIIDDDYKLTEEEAKSIESKYKPSRVTSIKKENKSKKNQKNSEDEEEDGDEEEESEDPNIERGKKRKKLNDHSSLNASGSSKKWSTEEEDKLLKIMKTSKSTGWKDVAVHFPFRSPDAVRNKYKKMMETGPAPSSSSTFKSNSKKQKKSRSGNDNEEESNSNQNENDMDDHNENDETMMMDRSMSMDSERDKYNNHRNNGDDSNVNVDEEDQDEDHDDDSGEKKAKRSTSGEADRRRKVWTPEEEDLLKQLVDQDIKPAKPEDWESIASKLGRTVKSVKHKYNEIKG